MNHFSNSKTFCIYPFTHLNIKSNGKLTVCNRCAPIEDVNATTSFSEFWQGPKVNELRKKILSGERPQECVACWKLEDSGATSYRQESLHRDSIHSSWLSKSKKEFDEGKYFVKELELRFGNRCNLQCKMCSPKFSSKWEKELKKNAEFNSWAKSDLENGDIYDLDRMVSDQMMSAANQKVLNSIEEIVSSLEYVMYSGGEPLLQREHYISLEKLLPNAENITLEYTTNLNYLNFEKFDVLEYWKKFRKVIIKISLDADPELYPYVRTGGDIKKVEENIRRIREVLSTSEVRLIGTCTTSVYNMGRLPQVMEYFDRLGLQAHTSIVEYPSFLSPQVLPPELKVQIEKDITSYLSEIRSDQRDTSRIEKWTKNCLNFCMGSDESHMWPHFLKFNSFWDKGNEELKKFYPLWEKYI